MGGVGTTTGCCCCCHSGLRFLLMTWARCEILSADRDLSWENFFLTSFPTARTREATAEAACEAAVVVDPVVERASSQDRVAPRLFRLRVCKEWICQ